MKILNGIVANFFVVLVLATSHFASASAVELKYAAVIDNVYASDGNYWGLEDLFHVGDSANLRFTYDSATPVKSIFSNGPDTYTSYSGNEFSISSGSFLAQTTNYTLSLIDGYYGGWDQFVVSANAGNNDFSSQGIVQGTSINLFAMNISFFDYSGKALTGSSLPTNQAGLAGFDVDPYHYLFIDPHSFSFSFINEPLQPLYNGSISVFTVSGHFDTVRVPEPSVFILFLIGLAGLYERRSVKG